MIFFKIKRQKYVYFSFSICEQLQMTRNTMFFQDVILTQKLTVTKTIEISCI